MGNVGYNLFTDIFEQNSGNFNYYGPTVFLAEQLYKIKEDFEKRVLEINEIERIEDLIDYCENTANALVFIAEWKYHKTDFVIEEEKLLNDIKKLGPQLIELLDKWIEKNRTLWVLGL